MLFVTEILRHRKACLSHTHTRSGRFVHLSEHQGCFLQYAGFFHLGPEVISLTGTLSDSGKDRVSAMLCGNVADQFLDQHGLAHAGAAEETNLAAFCVRRQKVDDFNSCLQDLHHRTLFFKSRRISVDHPLFGVRNPLSVINGFAQHIEKTSQRLLAHRHFNARACSRNLHVLVKSLAGRQHQAAHLVVAEMGGNLHDAFLPVILNFKCIFDKGKFAVFKYYVNDRPHDLRDSSFIHIHSHFLLKEM